MDIGAQLRTSRESQGLSLALLAEKTRVQLRILAAIELNDLSSIPPKPYGRGFVRAYAHEVGLDPDRTVRDYFGQFPPITIAAPAAAAAEAHQRAWRMPVVGVVLLTVTAVLLFRIGRDVSPGYQPSESLAVGTSGATSPTPASSTPSPATVSPRQTKTDGIKMVLRVSRQCWVAASADGKRVIYDLLPEGAQRTIQATREITFRAGDAGAVRLTVNGRDTGLFGVAGEVKSARITTSTADSFGATALRPAH